MLEIRTVNISEKERNLPDNEIFGAMLSVLHTTFSFACQRNKRKHCERRVTPVIVFEMGTFVRNKRSQFHLMGVT